MNARYLLVLTLLLAGNAHAQDSQTKKADAAWEAYKGGDGDALSDARAAIDKAIVHKTTLHKGSVWVLFGKIITEQTLANGMPSEDDLSAAVEAWQGAVERGAGKDAVSEDLLRLIASATQAMTDDLEAKQNDSAWSRATAALACRDLLNKTGGSEPRTEANLLQLATIVAVRSGHLDEAQTYFATWSAMGDNEASVAVQLTRALNESKDLETALAFAGPLLKANPADAALLPPVVQMLVTAEKAQDAEKLVNAAAPTASAGAGTDLMLGKLYLEVGNKDQASIYLLQGLERNPNLSEAWLPMASLHHDQAKADLAAIDADPAPSRVALNALIKSSNEHLQAATTLMEQARAAELADVLTLTSLMAIYDALGDDKRKQDVADAIAKAEQDEE
ncbi:MAG: hypothetical protein GWP91_07870 [Rhodobacterales bacterium]|nr:hypothetical protein [Rhodobacterales bacterium]